MKSILYKLVFFLFFTCSSQAYYQAEQGRWISRDPIEERGGINLNAFVNNSSVNRHDYLGRQFALNNQTRPDQASNDLAKGLRDACAALNSIVGKLDGKKCYNCKLERRTASTGQVNNSLENNDLTMVQGHGSPDRDRLLGDGSLNDGDMHDTAQEHGNQCKTYGCYGDDNPDRTTTHANAYSKMKDDLDDKGSDDNQPDCCPEVTEIRLYFGPM